MLNVAPIFITITTYGTWLHGDERGSFNRKGTTLRSHFVSPSAKLLHVQRMNMKQLPLYFDAAMRACVNEAVKGYCQFKAWRVMALHVRTNHLHALIQGEAKASRIIHGVKSAATRALRERGLIAIDRNVWTHGASATPCKSDADIAAVRHYIKHGQGSDLPMGSERPD